MKFKISLDGVTLSQMPQPIRQQIIDQIPKQAEKAYRRIESIREFLVLEEQNVRELVDAARDLMPPVVADEDRPAGYFGHKARRVG